ncbi:MAG TPA: ATP-binding protein, partial [Flavobacteriales bacterium]|nr:ATP-binding protein [Flavobacteriales bacterium]
VNAPHIIISHDPEVGSDHIRITDNGVGFDQKHKDQAFGVFKRLHSAEQFEGTGVGLAIVQRVITKHNGKVWAESEPGKGTTIHILLPKEHTTRSQIPFAKVA